MTAEGGGRPGSLRVTLISDAYPPVIGGATRAAQQLGRQLTRRGHRVTVLTAWQRDLPAHEDDEGVEVHRLRGLVSRFSRLSADPVRYTPPPFPDPEVAWRARSVLREARPDVVHSYGWLTYSCLPALRGSSAPLVLAAREYANICPVRVLVRQGRNKGAICSGPAWGKCHECSAGFYGGAKGQVAATSVLGARRGLARRIDTLHSTSTFTEQMIERHLMRGKQVHREVIPDFREDDIGGEPDAETLGRLPAGGYLLFVGAFRRIKGDQLLIDAYRRLQDPPPLVMIGARSAEPLPEFAPGVIPLFDVPHATVMAAWDGALAGVMPSVVPEALGNVVHEAMSRGRAVIGTRPGGHEDMIDDGVNGLLVPSGEIEPLVGAMKRLLADDAARERMGTAAADKAQEFTAEAVMPRIEELYRKAIAAGRR